MGDPVTKLDELKNTSKKVDDDLAKLTKEKETLKADITDLERVVQEINQLTTAYGQALKGIEKDGKDIVDYLSMKMPMIEAAIKERKEQKEEADKLLELWDGKAGEGEEKGKEGKLQIQEKTLQEKSDALDKITKEYETAKITWQEKKRAYECLRTRQKELEEKVKDLKNLKDQIGSKEAEKRVAEMYFLGRELDKGLDELKEQFWTQEKFKEEFIKSWQERFDQELKMKASEESLKNAKDAFDKENKALEEMEKGRRRQILEELNKLAKKEE